MYVWSLTNFPNLSLVPDKKCCEIEQKADIKNVFLCLQFKYFQVSVRLKVSIIVCSFGEGSRWFVSFIFCIKIFYLPFQSFQVAKAEKHYCIALNIIFKKYWFMVSEILKIFTTITLQSCVAYIYHNQVLQSLIALLVMQDIFYHLSYMTL